MFETLALNKSGATRREQLHGRQHVVVPCTMFKEGVWSGSRGPVFYPASEFEKSIPNWNHKPVVVYHPEQNGVPLSAATPEVLEARGVGIILNTKWTKGKLKTEVWLDEDKTNKVDSRIVPALDKNEKVEVSTGLYVDDEPVLNGEGDYGGKKYTVTARNFRPDHLAILPDQKGAFSVEDGGGLLANNSKVPVANALSYSDVERTISHLLRQKNKKDGYYWDGHLVDVYGSYFVYCSGDKYFQMEYSADGDAVKLTGTPVEVVRVTEYRKVSDGSYVGNSSGEFTSSLEKALMEKKDKVSWLIGNAGWAETDREHLSGCHDSVLDKMIEAKKSTPAPVANVTLVNNAEKKEEPKAVVVERLTMEQVVANSSPDVQEQFAEMNASYTAEKNRLIDTIVANKQNVYTKEHLATKKLGDLRAIAALAATPAPVTNHNVGVYTGQYAGAAGAPPVTANSIPAPLSVPKLDWTTAKK